MITLTLLPTEMPSNDKTIPIESCHKACLDSISLVCGSYPYSCDIIIIIILTTSPLQLLLLFRPRRENPCRVRFCSALARLAQSNGETRAFVGGDKRNQTNELGGGAICQLETECA